MTVDCLWELQKAVFTALDGDGTLSGLVTGVYSHVAQDTAFPYVKFADIKVTDWSTKSNSGIKGVFNTGIEDHKILFEKWIKMFNPDKLEWVHLVVTERFVFINGEKVK